MKQNIYNVIIEITQIDGFFGKYDDVVESVSVVASTPVDARRKAKRYILHKHKYLENLSYCRKIDVNLLFEGVNII